MSMMDKIKILPLMAYVAFMNFCDDLKNDERGVSPMVATVLLMLVAVLAVVLLWDKMSVWLGEIWDQIIGESGKIK